MENDSGKYLPELLAEKDSLDASFTHAMKLLSAEIERLQKGEKDGDVTYLDLLAAKSIKLKERVLIPSKQHPKFNFVGKILGPQGHTIKRLQEETGAKISVLGKGSTRDRAKEDALRKGGELKFAHLSMELHVLIEVFAPVPDAYMRMAHAMEEVKKFLIPDYMDDICQEQFMEMGRGQPGPGVRGRGGPPPPGGAPRGRGMLPRGGPTRGGMGRGAPPRGGAMRGAPAGRGGPAAPARGAPALRGARPPQRMAPPSAPHQHAQAAEGYQDYQQNYNESYTEPAYESYDNYYAQPQTEPQGEYFDYGHGESQEQAYNSYGAQDDWNGTQRPAAGGKAPQARQANSSFREHPYRQY